MLDLCGDARGCGTGEMCGCVGILGLAWVRWVRWVGRGGGGVCRRSGAWLRFLGVPLFAPPTSQIGPKLPSLE